MRPRRNLSRTGGYGILAVAALLLTIGLTATGATADGSGQCPVNDPLCSATGTGGSPGGGTGGTGGGDGGSGGGTCTYLGTVLPCYVPSMGYYSNNCYYREADPQPDATSSLWGSYTPATATMYEVSCYNGQPPWGTGAIDTVEQPVATGAAGPTPYELALEALAKIRLDPPDIKLAPTTDKNGVGGLVGLPVWMWTTVNPNTWGPISASASDAGLTVTITAQGNHIVWDMGDGKTVTCDNPGTVFGGTDGGASPDCGYRYKTPSSGQSGGRFAVTATSTWYVDWAGGGQSGRIVTTRTASVSVLINEAQVVVK